MSTSTTITSSAFRIVNTKEALMGPFGTRYVHDAARPFAVLFNRGRSEICCGRYPTAAGAKAAVIRFTAAHICRLEAQMVAFQNQQAA
jgi:hypothetical protein